MSFVFQSGKLRGFGSLAGISMEQLVFHPRGFFWVTCLLKDGRTKEVREAAKRILDRVDNRPVKAQCQCGRTARYAMVVGNNQYGYRMGGDLLFCEACQHLASFEKGRLLPISFRSFGFFSVQADRKQFGKLLRYCFFGNGNEKITREKAISFFFPEGQLSLF